MLMYNLSNIAIIIQKRQEVYCNIMEMSQFLNVVGTVIDFPGNSVSS